MSDKKEMTTEEAKAVAKRSLAELMRNVKPIDPNELRQLFLRAVLVDPDGGSSLPDHLLQTYLCALEEHADRTAGDQRGYPPMYELIPALKAAFLAGFQGGAMELGEPGPLTLKAIQDERVDWPGCLSVVRMPKALAEEIGYAVGHLEGRAARKLRERVDQAVACGLAELRTALTAGPATPSPMAGMQLESLFEGSNLRLVADENGDGYVESSFTRAEVEAWKSIPTAPVEATPLHQRAPAQEDETP